MREGESGVWWDGVEAARPPASQQRLQSLTRLPTRHQNENTLTGLFALNGYWYRLET